MCCATYKEGPGVYVVHLMEDEVRDNYLNFLDYQGNRTYDFITHVFHLPKFDPFTHFKIFNYLPTN